MRFASWNNEDLSLCLPLLWISFCVSPVCLMTYFLLFFSSASLVSLPQSVFISLSLFFYLFPFPSHFPFLPLSPLFPMSLQSMSFTQPWPVTSSQCFPLCIPFYIPLYLSRAPNLLPLSSVVSLISFFSSLRLLSCVCSPPGSLSLRPFYPVTPICLFPSV
jgi:hypothetical protein